MKRHISLRHLPLFAALFLALGSMQAQSSKDIQNWRPWDQRGVNMFETPKTTVTDEEDGFRVRIGGNFTQQFQAISHENNADRVLVNNTLTPAPNDSININKLYDLGPGFNLASANLNLDIQLDRGIRVALENYMSSRHHSEFWVKGGYIQVDELPMFGNPQWFSKYVTVKFGHMEVNYGDQHFRRSDNGNAGWNPFVGNYIMDAFATEIGGEVYIKHPSGLMGMVGMTAGLIGGDVKDPNPNDLPNVPKKSPSLLFKLAYDKQVTDDFRFRLSGSMYMNDNTIRNTLYGGDRTGSRFFYALEPEYYLSGSTLTATTSANRFTSGRLDPGFGNKITSIMINPFVKFKGLEFFGTYETSKGKRIAETEDRDFTQISGEVIYRFLPREQVYVGARYNNVEGRLQGFTEDIGITRTEVVAGWYATKNLLVKGEYILQNYTDFPITDYRSEGKFNGFMVEAVVSF